MAYNPTNDKSAGYISHYHQSLLDRLKTAHKRTKRGVLEYLIEKEANAMGIYLFIENPGGKKEA